MDEKTLTSTQIIKVLDKNRCRLMKLRRDGIITEDEEKQGAMMIAGIAEELGLFYGYAFYHTQERA